MEVMPRTFQTNICGQSTEGAPPPEVLMVNYQLVIAGSRTFTACGIRNAYETLGEKCEGPFEDPKVDGMIILKGTLKETVWTALMWLSVRTSGDLW